MKAAKKKSVKDSWKKLGMDLAEMADGSVDCHLCDYWKGQSAHKPTCLIVRARALRKGAAR